MTSGAGGGASQRSSVTTEIIGLRTNEEYRRVMDNLPLSHMKHSDRSSSTNQRKRDPHEGHRTTHTIVRSSSPDCMRKSKSRLTYECNQCPWTTQYNKDMKKHRKRHEEGTFSCDICNMPFRAKSHLTGHKRQEHGVGNVDKSCTKHCKLCPYTTIHNGDLARHKKKHVHTKFHCNFCNYPFANEMIMAAHIRKEHTYDDWQIHSRKSRQKESECKTNTYQNRTKEHTSNSNIISQNRHEQREHSIEDRNSKPHLKEQRKNRANKEYNTEIHNNHNVSNYDVSNEASTILQERVDSFCTDREIPLSIKYNRDEKADHSFATNLTKEDSSDKESIQSSSKTSMSSVEDVEVVKYQDIETKDLGHISVRLNAMSSTSDKKSKKKMSNRFTCLKCVYVTSEETAFRRHTQRHERGKFECKYCKMPYIFRDNLDNHVAKNHGYDSDTEKILSSCECSHSESNNSEQSLSPPKNTNEDKLTDNIRDIKTEDTRDIKCAFCAFKTTSYHKLKRHIDKKHTFNIDTFVQTANANKEDILQDSDTTGDDDKEQTVKEDIECVGVNEITKDPRLQLSEISDMALDGSNTSLPQYSGTHDWLVEDMNENELRQSSTFLERRGKNANIPREKSKIFGRLDKETFRKTKKFYAKLKNQSRFKYECLICESDNMFKTITGIWSHFKRRHKKLRQRICKSCRYCSKPFPKAR